MRSERWRSGFPVLVAEAQTTGSVAVIRSLGRAGYPVHACAREAGALGLGSAYAAARAVCPGYDRPGFVPWLRDYVAEHRIAAVVPSEGLLLALREHFDDFAHLLPYQLPREALYAGLSKHDLLASLGGAPGAAGANLPPTLLVDLDRPPPGEAEVEVLGPGPYYVKVDGLHARAGAPGAVHPEPTARAAAARLAGLAASHRRAVVQAHVPGQGVGAFFLLRGGRVAAELMHRRLHEVPHTGGTSSLRESWLDPAVRDDALAKLRHLGWDGVAMMEYRREPSGRFHLMELNGRFWGSLHLALWAGVDFPRLALDTHFGRREPPPTPRLGVRVRHTFPAEVRHVWSRLRDPALPRREKAASVAGFALLGLDPRVHSDLLFPGDRALYLRGLRDFAREVAAARLGYGAVKRGAYRAARGLGLFHLARRLTRRSVRVLCYHGTAMRDEARFRPQLFIEPEAFERRLGHLQQAGYPVVGLGRAVEGLARGDLPDCATVITIDDGFYSTYRHAAPALLRRGLPATVYVTSYHCAKGTPVFRLAVQYLLWATRAEALDLARLGPPFAGRAALTTEAEREALAWVIVQVGEGLGSEAARVALCRRLGAALGVDYEALARERRLGLMTPEEIRELAGRGIDIQLHTHRHRLPDDEPGTRREIEENRAFLEPLVGRRLEHFCYPSGLWSERHPEWLRGLGVRSATTTDLGLASAASDPLALDRFLDSAEISQIEFEAELSGFAELLRRARAWLEGGRRITPGSGAAALARTRRAA